MDAAGIKGYRIKPDYASIENTRIKGYNDTSYADI